MSNAAWSLQQVWNDSLEQRKDRKLTARNRIWASELGGSMIDRVLKMKGVEPTNPPNARSLRKFEAGNLMEWVVGVVLKRAGILQANQEWLEYQYDGLLPVTGKLDFLAGGQPDWEEAKKRVADIANFGLPDIFATLGTNIVDKLIEQFGEGMFAKPMKTIVLEIKSTSSFMYEKYERDGKPSDNHRLQCFHYMKAKGIDEGHIIYISKDDLRLLEFGIFDTPENEAMYKADIEEITNYMKTNAEPEKASDMIYDFETGRFSDNWHVKYSNYLTMLYGYKNQFEYDSIYMKLTPSFNRVFKRMVQGKKMTALNLKVIGEDTEVEVDDGEGNKRKVTARSMRSMFPNLDVMVKDAQDRGLFQDEEGGEES